MRSFLYYLTCCEGRIQHIRGQDPARWPPVVHPWCKASSYFIRGISSQFKTILVLEEALKHNLVNSLNCYHLY